MDVEFCHKLFLLCGDDHLVFILQFVNFMNHIDWFAGIEPSLYPWDKSHLIMVYNPFIFILFYFGRAAWLAGS